MLHPGLEDALEEPHRGAHVVAPVEAGVHHRFADLDARGEVQHGLDLVLRERAPHKGPIAHVAPHQRHAFRDRVGVPRREVVDHDDPVPLAPKDAHHVRSDVPGAARHTDVHRRGVSHSSRLFRSERLPSGPPRGKPRRMKTLSGLRPLAFAPLLPLLLIACGHTPPPQTAASATGTPATLSSVTPQRKSDQDISLSKDIRDVCKIDDSERAPKFDFDSSQLSSSDRDILQQVAKCMTDGALKGKNIELIGRADARGEQEYNMTLGSSRATAAHKFLDGLGIDDKRMGETSRGALDATGHDEQGYAKDRRVDIRVAGPVSPAAPAALDAGCTTWSFASDWERARAARRAHTGRRARRERGSSTPRTRAPSSRARACTSPRGARASSCGSIRACSPSPRGSSTTPRGPMPHLHAPVPRAAIAEVYEEGSALEAAIASAPDDLPL